MRTGEIVRSAMTLRRSPVRCPCGSGARYADCCGALHAGLHDDGPHAMTPEQLMRSRFSAFAVGDAAYLLGTWHASTRPPALDLDDGLQWRQLDVHDAFADEEAGTGVVAFTAYFADASGQLGQLQERSRFVREGGRWRYVDALD